VRVVVDVRSIPRSRTNPQFNIESLPGSLAEFEVGYQHMPDLGGRRHHPRSAPPSPNTFWRNESFRSFADYAGTDEFNVGLARLRDLAYRSRSAVMCSEAVWWRCQPRLYSGCMILDGLGLLHI